MTRIVAAAVAGSMALAGQVPSQQVFHTSADMVPVYVMVMGRDGRAIAGLPQADFTVLDNGKRQPITFFSAARHPFAVAMVLDGTFSMMLGAGLGKQLDAARAIAEALDPDDQVALGSLARPAAELSNDKLNVSRLLRGGPLRVAHDESASPETQPSRGLAWALASLGSYDGRRIVVMFTDGRNQSTLDDLDFSSQASVPLALQLVKQADQVDVSIHVIAFDDSMVDEGFLAAFASTGGGASLIARDANLTSVAREFVDELHNEYLIGFVPAQFDGKNHKVEIKVNRPGVKVRARTSYFAPKR